MAGGSVVPGAGDVESPAPSLIELGRVYLKISLLGFGGPNAHLALMLDEIVERRGWLSRERFLELMAVTNVLPGPNSSEMAIHIGYTQRGWPGALVTGLAFVMPTFFIVTALSAAYFRFGTLPAVDGLFWGLQPVIVAIVTSAGWKIGRTAVRTPLAGVLAVAGGVVSVLSGEAIIAIMLLGGVTTWWRPLEASTTPLSASPDSASADRVPPDTAPSRTASSKNAPRRRALIGGALVVLAIGAGALLLGAPPAPLVAVLWTHLWVGSVLFGGGYVLVALLQPYAVGTHGWLTAGQFLDGVALTQAVPGPISTLAAFVGYGAAGPAGALLGTLGIYLPAFACVLFFAPRLERLRRVEAVRHALDGVVAVAAGAVVGVGFELAATGVQGPATATLAALALVLSLRWKVPAVWLVALGLVVGVLRLALV